MFGESMKLSQNMIEVVHEIKRIEPFKKTNRLNVSVKELGLRMIDLYYSTQNVRTRELIMSFMEDAGFNWIRKLITRDTTPVIKDDNLSSLDDYVHLIAANEEDFFPKVPVNKKKKITRTYN